MEDIKNAFIDPETPDVDYSELDFDAQLKHTQNIKNRVLHKLVNGSIGGIPSDKESVELILKVADSMDKTTIAKKRANTEEKNGNDAVSILNAIAQSIAGSKGENPFVKGEGNVPSGGVNIGDLPDFQDKHADGEGEIGVILETSDAFTTRMDAVNRAAMAEREAAMGLTDVVAPTKTP